MEFQKQADHTSAMRQLSQRLFLIKGFKKLKTKYKLILKSKKKNQSESKSARKENKRKIKKIKRSGF